MQTHFDHAQRAAHGHLRWPWVRIVLWALLVLTLTVAAVVGASLDRCDPDGNLIAFRSYRSGIDGLYAVEADRGTLCRLALAGAGGSIASNHVAWSPAGDALAWIDANRLFVQRVGDARPIALTNPVTNSEWPLAWSPDGTHIAVVTSRPDGVRTLAVVTVTSPPALRNLAVVEQPVLDPNGPPPRSQLAGSRLVWSPDGRSLLLDRGQQIIEVDADGTALRVPLARGQQPAWSPNGAWIGFTRDGALVIAAADGTGERVLSRRGQAPVWSPDGAWIAFRTDAGVAVARPDGSTERLLFHGPVTPITENNAASYAWSPDSQRLAVLAYELRGATSVQPIVIVTLVDGQLRHLIDRGHNRSLAWRPDGWRTAAATATELTVPGGLAMIGMLLGCGALWLVSFGAFVLGRRLAPGSTASVRVIGPGRHVLAVGAFAGGSAGLVLWVVLLLGTFPTVQVEGGEFGWLPYVTRFPLLAILGGGLVGLVAAIGVQRDGGWLSRGLRAVGVLGLSWAVYGLVLAQVPVANDLPLEVTLARRATAALGCAAVTIVVVDWYRFPPLGARLDTRLLERVLIAVASLLVVLLAQTLVWDELLARALGVPIR